MLWVCGLEDAPAVEEASCDSAASGFDGGDGGGGGAGDGDVDGDVEGGCALFVRLVGVVTVDWEWV